MPIDLSVVECIPGKLAPPINGPASLRLSKLFSNSSNGLISRSETSGVATGAPTAYLAKTVQSAHSSTSRVMVQV